ncbi:hypothetical protein [Actinoplanes sp. NBRC 103695]|uniref:leucine-rich repeat domain-containing protein n=1 Tax=Actinoplanes sp. NBRC 103695 TaxID=3032202 RepID=UPI0024A0B229|nr:hypothetical protein [Actinoplanes sp. NBRC 103695]GLY97768.1 hypothetical protein Acsp02_50220 [Actinoplanes sp. NBRC 103695]
MTGTLDPVLLRKLPANEAEWPALTKLAAMGVRDLAGIERCSSLEILSLSGCGDLDVGHLAGLPHLEVLEISDSGLTSIEGLAGHPRLGSFILSRNLVADLRPLLQMPSLGIVDVVGNPITDDSFHQVVPKLQAQGKFVQCSTRADWQLTLRLRAAGLPFSVYRTQGKLRLVSPGLDHTDSPAFGHVVVSAAEIDRLLTDDPAGVNALFAKG